MDRGLDQGLPFELYDLWRESVLSSSEPRKDLFQDLKIDIPDLPSLQDSDQTAADAVHLILPALQPIDDVALAKPSAPNPPSTRDTRSAHPTEDPNTQNFDPWNLEDVIRSEDHLPQLKTWEVFQGRSVPEADATRRLSGLGPTAISTAFARQGGHRNSTGVLLQHSILHPLYNLALGRSSVFFSWNEERCEFVSVLPDVPIHGLSLVATQSVVEKAMHFGSLLRSLRNRSVSYVSRWPVSICASQVALMNCIAEALDAIESHLSGQFTKLRSLLQFQELLSRPQRLLILLQYLLERCIQLPSNSVVISAVRRIVQAQLEEGSEFGPAAQAVLRSVSIPWLEETLYNMGLIAGSEAHDQPTTVETETTQLDTSFPNGAGWRIEDDMLDNLETLRFSRETKEAVRLLRQHVPDSAVIRPQNTGMNDILRSILKLDKAAEELLPKVKAYEKAVLESVDQQYFGIKYHQIDTTAASVSPPDIEQEAWVDSEEQSKYLEDLDTQISNPTINGNSELSNLHQGVTAALRHKDALSNFAGLDTPFQADPLEPFQPLIATQWCLTNHILLRQLFEEDLLQRHLDLQRDFHLFGNGNFVNRLTTALFSQETQSAERRRGNLPTSEAMGLRLGTKQDQRWPPASSELRLTLMGILNEAYFSNDTQHSMASNPAKELPGGLNFSIRELPEADIDKVIDAGSIYALDFLRLQYTAPPLLDAILTPATMRAYDDVFKFMLRLLRMNDVTTTLRIQVTSLQRQKHHSAAATRFSIQARHIITTLTSYFVELGIATPWNRFMSSIDEVKIALARISETAEFPPEHQQTGIADLRRGHESCLEIVRTRLFLRRKYEKIRTALEEVFTEILKGASTISNTETETRANDFRTFDDALTRLLEHLQILIGRARKVADIHDAASANGEREDELVRILLYQLDWNGYYGKADDEMSALL